MRWKIIRDNQVAPIPQYVSKTKVVNGETLIQVGSSKGKMTMVINVN